MGIEILSHNQTKETPQIITTQTGKIDVTRRHFARALRSLQNAMSREVEPVTEEESPVVIDNLNPAVHSCTLLMYKPVSCETLVVSRHRRCSCTGSADVTTSLPETFGGTTGQGYCCGTMGNGFQ